MPVGQPPVSTPTYLGQVVTVDPTQRIVDVVLNSSGTRVQVTTTPICSRWPMVGETWTVRNINNSFYLGEPYQSYQLGTQANNPGYTGIEEIPAGDAWINSPTGNVHVIGSAKGTTDFAFNQHNIVPTPPSTSGLLLKTNGTGGSYWGSGLAQAVVSLNTVNQTYTAHAGDLVMIANSGQTVYLPGSPNYGDMVVVNGYQSISPTNFIGSINANGKTFLYHGLNQATIPILPSNDMVLIYTGDGYWRALAETFSPPFGALNFSTTTVSAGTSYYLGNNAGSIYANGGVQKVSVGGGVGWALQIPLTGAYHVQFSARVDFNNAAWGYVEAESVYNGNTAATYGYGIHSGYGTADNYNMLTYDCLCNFNTNDTVSTRLFATVNTIVMQGDNSGLGGSGSLWVNYLGPEVVSL